jgi:hypothetical protein
MNYLFVSILLTCATLSAQQEAQQTPRAQAVDKAKEAVRNFRKEATCQEYGDFVIYMESAYRSWYQSVNPEIQLRDKLTPAALDLVKTARNVMRPFEQKPPEGLLGASKLSEAGDQAYQEQLIPYAKTLQCVDFNQVPETRYL